jgi:endoglucanase
VPDFQGSGKSAWVSKAVQTYYASDAVGILAKSLDQAVAFSQERNVPVWCGEFGVYNLRADPTQRVGWYRTVRGLLEDRHIPWTMWDYRNSFGLFQKDSSEVFTQDLNLPLVQALGFYSVPQSPPSPIKETAGFALYRDFWESGSREGGYNHNGSVNYADPDQPHSGMFSIKIEGVDRYSVVAWKFAPWKDMTALADHAALSLWARSTAKFSVQARFVDGVVPGDLPWRNGATIDSTLVPPDGQWHHVKLPLSAMKVTGAWDGTWHDPTRPFAWGRVDHFEIVADYTDLAGIKLGFDDIEIVTD